MHYAIVQMLPFLVDHTMQNLLLLHGALGSSEQLKPLMKSLGANFNVFSFSFSGHGGNELPSVFTIQLFSEEVIQFCKDRKIHRTAIFGYSMGGYVALYLAKHHPELVDAVITLGTKLHWDEATAAKEVAMMQPEIIEQKIPAFADQLQQLHEPTDWKMIMIQTANMLTSMGQSNPLTPSEYKDIQCIVLLLLGDRDKMVTLDETIAAYKQFPKAQLAILPNTQHAIEKADTEIVSLFIRKLSIDQ